MGKPSRKDGVLCYIGWGGHMTLDPPIGEGCGNCKFCISYTEEKNMGFITITTTKNEIFICRRNTPTEFYFNGYTRIEANRNIHVDKNYWCGEWKERIVGNKI